MWHGGLAFSAQLVYVSTFQHSFLEGTLFRFQQATEFSSSIKEG